jgi:hypothetical protein
MDLDLLSDEEEASYQNALRVFVGGILKKVEY